MSMLARYQKSGGFNQLLKLIEGFGPQKQEKFLSMIEQENSAWAMAIKDKMINIQKIFSWDGTYLGEVIIRLPELTVATVLHSFPENQREKALSTLGFAEKKRILDLIAEKTPNEGEINSSCVRLVNEVRDLFSQNILRADKIDPKLSVPDNIEEILSSGKNPSTGKNPTLHEDEEGGTKTGIHLDFSVVENMGKISQEQATKIHAKLLKMAQEIAQLKTENKILKDKLTQIKKIA